MVFGIAVLERITWYVAHTTYHLDAYTGDPSFAVRVKAAFGGRNGRPKEDAGHIVAIDGENTAYTEGSELIDEAFDWHQFLGRESED